LPLPSTQVSLPLSGPEREALESMRIRFGAELFVTDVYAQHRGQLTLSTGEPLWVPTEYMDPGSTAAAGFRRNRAHSIDVQLPGTPGAPLPVGSTVGDAIGLFGHDGRDPLLRLAQADYDPAPMPAAPPGASQLRVVNANLLNFFNGDGRGGGFPAERGARSRDEFENQKARLRAALDAMRPDLLAVQELENDGFGPDSAAADLLRLLEAGGRGPYRAIETSANRVGSDVIAVGLFYRESVLEPIGRPSMLAAEPFRDLSRQPLAQVFRHRATGATFLAVVNHLKSKGSCPDPGPNANQGDGQGCWNTARVEAVHALLPWLEEKAIEAGTDNILVLGDMNAYRREDPITVFRDAGYLELVETLEGLPQYSYRFFGQAGTLDYAFATPKMAAAATGAQIWHINADWPARMTLSEPWLRMSDHDPVIVDFEFAPGD
jgi:predicted extracellular nuclease